MNNSISYAKNCINTALILNKRPNIGFASVEIDYNNDNPIRNKKTAQT